MSRLNPDGTDPEIVAAKNALKPMTPVPARAAKPNEFEMGRAKVLGARA